MTILFPIGSFYPAQQGGPANTIYWQARALHEKGHTVYVGTTDIGLKEHDIVKNEWIENECGKVLYQKTSIPYVPLILMIRLRKVIRSSQIVHLTSLFYPLSWMMALWIILTRQKCHIVWSVRGELEDNALVFSSFRKKLALVWMKPFFRKRVIFHATSENEEATLKRVLGNDIRVIQLPNFMILPEKLDSEVTKTILYLGRIHPIKALENLIEAFSNITDKKDFLLVIAGDDSGPYADKLKGLCKTLGIASDVQFPGHIVGIEKQKLLSGAYMLVLPSHTENFGNVVIEALAQGTPVIASQNTPWGILESVQKGTWVPNNPASITKALVALINLEDNMYVNIRQRSYALCRDVFSIKENINKWETTYQNIISNKYGKPVL